MPDPKILDFIQSSKNHLSKEEIFLQLLHQGRKIEDIQQAYSQISADDDGDDAQKRTVQIVVLIGALLIGAGVFSFVASNWQDMGSFVRVSIIILAMLAAYALAWYMKEVRGYQRTGDALYLLGGLIFGGGIFLVGQIYNVRTIWPDGLILWLFGSIVMGFAVKSYLLLYLAMVLGVVSVFSHPFSIWSSFGHDRYLLTSSLLLLSACVLTYFSGVLVRRRHQQNMLKQNQI